MSLTIRYCAEGEAVSDFAVEEWYEKVRAGGDFKVSNELPLTRVRVGIFEGEIPHTDVEFLFEGHVLQPTVEGRLFIWPHGFCDAFSDLLFRLFSI